MFKSREEFEAWECASRDSIDVKRAYIIAAGDLAAGVLLSQVVFQFLPNPRTGERLSFPYMVERDEDQWLVMPRDEWWLQCCVSPDQFDRLAAKLRDRGLLKTKVWYHEYWRATLKHVALVWPSFLEELRGAVEHYTNRKALRGIANRSRGSASRTPPDSESRTREPRIAESRSGGPSPYREDSVRELIPTGARQRAPRREALGSASARGGADDSGKDTRYKHAAIQAVRSLNHKKHYPSKLLFDDIIRLLGDDFDEELLTTCAREAARRGKQHDLELWLFTWYPAGGPVGTRDAGRPAPARAQESGEIAAQSAAGLRALVDAAVSSVYQSAAEAGQWTSENFERIGERADEEERRERFNSEEDRARFEELVGSLSFEFFRRGSQGDRAGYIRGHARYGALCDEVGYDPFEPREAGGTVPAFNLQRANRREENDEDEQRQRA